MFPGDPAQTVTATIKNNGTENYKLQGVKAYVTTGVSACDSTNYLLNGAPAPSTALTASSLTLTPVELAPAATTTGTFTIQFNNKATNQDACKGVAVTVNYVAN
jgi:hypothetical protein